MKNYLALKTVVKNILKPRIKSNWCYRLIKYPTFASYVHKIIKNNITKNDKVLDVGSRRFPYTKDLKCKELTGIDLISESNGELGWTENSFSEINNKSIDFYIANAEEMPFSNNYFNIVILTEVIEHIENDKNVISEISRVLSPQGKLILTTPNGRRVENLNPYHLRHYDPVKLKKLLNKYFNDVKIWTKFPFILLHERQYKYKNMIFRYFYIYLNKIINLASIFSPEFSGYTIFAICTNSINDNNFKENLSKAKVVCPGCKGKLVFFKESIKCDKCNKLYKYIYNIPALLTKMPHHQIKA